MKSISPIVPLLLLILFPLFTAIGPNSQEPFLSPYIIQPNHLFLIPEPSHMARVTSTTINPSTFACSSSPPPIIQINQRIAYQVQPKSEMHQQIVSTTLSPVSKTMWALINNGTLSNGSMVWQRQGGPTRMYSQIFATEDNLYINYQGSIHDVVFKQESWSVGEMICQGPIVKVLTTADEIYVLGHLFLTVFKGQQLQRTHYALKNQFFIDFDLFQNNLFLLTNRGLFILNALFFKTQRMEVIENCESAFMIRANGHCFVIAFQKEGKTTLQEFYIQPPPYNIEDGRLLFLAPNSLIRPGKLHRQFEIIKDLMLQENYVFVLQQFYFSLMELNVNTGDQLTMLENRKKIRVEEPIISMACLSADDGITIMLTGGSSIKVSTIVNRIEKNNLFRAVLECTSSQQPGEFILTVTFHGVCGNRHWQCSHQQIYQVRVTDQEKQTPKQQTSILNLLILLSISTGILVVAGCWCWRAKRSAAKKKNDLKQGDTCKKQNDSMIEMSMERKESQRKLASAAVP